MSSLIGKVALSITATLPLASCTGSTPHSSKRNVEVADRN